MEPLFSQNFEITDLSVDRYGRLRPAQILFLAQEVAGKHCNILSVDYETLAQQKLFWAVTRHRVQITRMPRRGETIRVETWPMPTTRVAYPRSMVAYDEQGNECFRSISLWVLMHLESRNMVLPGKSGICVEGTLRGTELATPGGLAAREMENHSRRQVRYTDLDRNGHMNNTRILDWVNDLLPSAFHENHTAREFSVCYFSEAREGEELDLCWEITEEGVLQVDCRREGEKQDRTIAARILFD